MPSSTSNQGILRETCFHARSFIAVACAVLLAVSTAAATEAPTEGRGAAEDPAVAGLAKELDSWRAVGDDRYELYARLENGKLFRVKSPDDWPDETDTSYAIVRDEEGRIRLLQITPTSLSGDWSETFTWLFDESGDRAVEESYLGTFQCADDGKVLQRTSLRFFDAGGGLLAERTASIDGRTHAPTDDSGCSLRSDDDPDYSDLTAALKHERLTRLARQPRAGS